ncbi:MAG TPA: MarR family transcriptional regulator [Rhodoblastus sp.]|nr:MarR family transcriptional regulator [Rhodoblastus sp.]
MGNEKQERAGPAGAETPPARRPARRARALGAAAAPKPDNPPPPETSLGHLDNVLGYVLRRAQVAVFNDFRRTFAGYDLSPTQYAVLSILAEHPGMRQGDVSAALGVKRTNFVAVLDELERRGLARRKAVAADRRSRALYLTPEGEKLAAEVRRLQDEHEVRLAALLPNGERDRLIDLLRRLTQGIGASADED